MRVRRTLIIASFMLGTFVQTNVLFAVSQNADSVALSKGLTSKTKEVIQKTEVSFKKAVDTLSQKKFILKNQAAVTAVETQVVAQKIGLWQRLINSIATPLVPLFTPRVEAFIDQTVHETEVDDSVVPVAQISAGTPVKAVVKAVTPKVLAPIIRNVAVEASTSEIAKLRAEMLALDNATRQYARDLEDRKIDSLAQSIDRSFSPVIQQVNNFANNPVVSSGNGNFNFSETVDGLEYAGGVLSTTVGYTIPLTASTTEWSTFYQTPSTRITAGSNCSWVGNTFNCVGGGSSATTTINGTNGPTFAFNAASGGTDFNIATSSGTITFNIPTASASARGLLSSLDFARIPLTASTTDWNTFYNTPSNRITAGANLAWVGNTLGFNGVLPIANGGIATSTTPTYGQLLVGNGVGGYNLISTSSLGISGGGSGTVGSGTTGQLPYYAAGGTTLSATSTLFLSALGNLGVGTTTPASKISFVQGGIGPWNNANGGISINNSFGNSIAGFTNSVSGDYAGMSFYRPGGVADVGDLQLYSLGSSYISTGLFTPLTSIIVSRSDFTSGLKIGAQAGPLSLFAGGINASNVGLVLSTAGNVGIGTTSPASKLQVYESGDSSSITTFTQGVASAGMQVSSDFVDGNYTPGVFWSTVNNNPSKPKAGIFTRNTNIGTFLYIGTSEAYGTGITNTAITIDPTGNVGIGTSTPYAKLSVAGTIVGANFVGTTTATSTFGGGLNITSGCYAVNGICVGGAGGGSGTVGSGTTGQFPYYAANGTTLSATSTLFMSAIGNIGINDTTPDRQLTIFTAQNTTPQVRMGYSDTFFWDIGRENQTTGRLMFIDQGGEKMSLLNNGNLGIGTTSPFAKLSITSTTAGQTTFAIASTTGTPVFSVAGNGGVVVGSSQLSTSAFTIFADNGSLAQIQRNAAASSFSQIDVVQPSGSQSTGDGFSLIALGSTYSGSGAFVGDGAFLGANAGLSEGFSIAATNPSAPIKFFTGGSAAANERLRITSAGLVGIGDTAPDRALTIFTAQNTTPQIRIGNTDSFFWDIGRENQTTGRLMFIDQGGEKMSLLNNGNLGVGTTTPGALLSVNGTILGQTINTYGTGTSTHAGGINVTSGCYAVGGVCIGGSGTVGSGTAGQLPFYAAGGTTLSASSTIFLGSSGSVGIGTTTPLSNTKLSLYSSASSAGPVYGIYVNSFNGDTSLPGEAVGAYFKGTATGGGSSFGLKVEAGPSSSEESVGIQVQADPGNGSGVGVRASAYLGTGVIGSGITGVSGASAHASGKAGYFIQTDVAGYSLYAEGGKSYFQNNVGIGTTTPAVKLSVIGNAQFTAVTSGAYSSDLNITANGTLTTSASDIRLKENITEISTSTLDRLKALKAYTFSWKTDPDHRLDVGLIAQEVEFVFPELVFTNKTDGFKGVNYSRLSIFLLKGIQEQQIQLDELKKYTTVLKLKELHTEKLCVGTEGDELCITREDLRNLLQGHAVPNNSGGSSTGETSAPAPSTDPEPTDTGSSTPTTDEDVVPPPSDTPAEEIPVETPPEPVVEPQPESSPQPVE